MATSLPSCLTTFVTPSQSTALILYSEITLKGSFVRDNDHFVCHTTGATFYNGDIVYF